MKFIRKYIFSITIALLIIAASFINPSDFGKIKVLRIPNADKLTHAIMYFIFAFTLFYENRKFLFSVRQYFTLGLIPIIFGLFIELLQPVLTVSRSREFADELFNLTGVVLAIIIWYFINTRRKKSQDNISVL